MYIQMYLIRLDILAFVDITVSTVSSILNGTNSVIKGLHYELKYQ